MEVRSVENVEFSPKKWKSQLQTPLRLPPSLKRQISLSDIIAATIGEEARSYSFHEELNVSNNLTEPNYENDSANSQYGQSDFLTSLTSENSSNACDFSSFNMKSDTNDTKTATTFSNSQKEFKTSFGTEPMLNIGFDTSFDFLADCFNDDDKSGALKIDNKTDVFQADSKERDTKLTTPKTEEKTPNSNPNDSKEASYDSDLEDSMHFIDPDDASFHDDKQPKQESGTSILEHFKNSYEKVPEPVRKRSRLNLHEPNSDYHDNSFSDGNNPEFMAIFEPDFVPPMENSSTAKFRHNSGPHHSFSGQSKHKLSRQHGKRNLLDKQNSSPGIGRHRSFSEACTRKRNNSFSSLLHSPESETISKSPMFGDLKSLLLNDCQTIDCPRTLFETLSNAPKQDVYARERNLQAKFSTLQYKYPDEVRDLCGFYRQQSAEIETERLKKIHDENVPTSYRKHLHRFYDDQLHRIMERVEKSLTLLSTVKRECVTINRLQLKSRPLLSKKAVSMMEEWYSRNLDHPYPSQTTVEALASAGDITPEQVKKWFANKRNRFKNTKPVPEIANIKRKRQYSARW